MAAGRTSLAMVALLIVACQAYPETPIERFFKGSKNKKEDKPSMQRPEELHSTFSYSNARFEDVQKALKALDGYLGGEWPKVRKVYNENRFLDGRIVERLLNVGHDESTECSKFFEEIEQLEVEVSSYDGLRSYLEQCKGRQSGRCADYLRERVEAEKSMTEGLDNASNVIYTEEEVSPEEMKAAIDNALAKLAEAYSKGAGLPKEPTKLFVYNHLVRKLRKLEKFCRRAASEHLLDEDDKVIREQYKLNPNVAKYLDYCRKTKESEPVESAHNGGASDQ
jgi:hypothetical protein